MKRRILVEVEIEVEWDETFPGAEENAIRHAVGVYQKPRGTHGVSHMYGGYDVEFRCAKRVQ